MLKTRIDADLKTALLAGDKQKALVLRGLKSAILYEEVRLKQKDAGLNDSAIQTVLRRESKKRIEAIDMYKSANEQGRAENEQAEKEIIDEYLPAEIDESKLKEIIKTKIAELSAGSMADMGKVIASVKAATEGNADGAKIAAFVKEALSGESK